MVEWKRPGRPEKGKTMDTENIGRALRREARRAADEARQQEAERLTRQALEDDEFNLLGRVEERLLSLGRAWAVHEQPLQSRLPLLGPLLSRLSRPLLRFLLQRQVAFNAELARTLQEVHQLYQILHREQVERAMDLFAHLEEHLLGLEARCRDLEEEVERLRQGPAGGEG